VSDAVPALRLREDSLGRGRHSENWAWGEDRIGGEIAVFEVVLILW
jgi:hypothetical protein